MTEYGLLINIDNKEILLEILNHSIDILIENQDEQQTVRMSHKYGFQNPDDFLLTVRSISKLYRNICCRDFSSDHLIDYVNSELSHLTPEFKKIVIYAIQTRREEMLRFLIREQNAINCSRIESFDWDTRLILGYRSFAQNNKLLTTLTLNLRVQSHKKQLHVEMDYQKLNEFIGTIESALS